MKQYQYKHQPVLKIMIIYKTVNILITQATPYSNGLKEDVHTKWAKLADLHNA